ncbi:MAG: DUF1730 domain-containing protein [Thermoguttaceae bacterium]|nr:DUF1730 domain-containing protein [Thermoguttaceae bacterium]
MPAHKMTSLGFSPFYRDFRTLALELGLAETGAAPAQGAKTYELFLERVNQGFCENLSYLTDAPEKRRDLTSVLPDVQTIFVVALPEKKLVEESAPMLEALDGAQELRNASESGESGAIVGYASCLDYHDVLRKKLKALEKLVLERFPNASTRKAVDTAPILEKDWARASGLGFVGLHSLLVTPSAGSRVFLGELLVSVPFQEATGFSDSADYLAALSRLRRRETGRSFDADEAERRCQSCRRCVDACPTRALNGDKTLDSRRCLNFWTIENRAELPEDIKEKLGDALFGCDRCQRVCPWNARLTPAEERRVPIEAIEKLDDETFRRLFRKTPIFRATLDGLKRVAEAIQDDHKKSPTRE